jgi:hypothetical protein
MARKCPFLVKWAPVAGCARRGDGTRPEALPKQVCPYCQSQKLPEEYQKSILLARGTETRPDRRRGNISECNDDVTTANRPYMSAQRTAITDAPL